MNTMFSLYKRATGIFYIKNKETGKHSSLKTRDRSEAQRLLFALNEAHNQPQFNLALARIYLKASDYEMTTRTWQVVMESIISQRKEDTRRRWESAVKDKNFDGIRDLPLASTRPEDFLQAIANGTVSTNAFLRRLHNHALVMDWLIKPIIVRRQWPKLQHRPRRAITLEEHQRILVTEKNPEIHAFYQLCWFLGGAQSDIAWLCAEDIDWREQFVAFQRKKTRSLSMQHFGSAAAAVLRTLPRVPVLKIYRALSGQRELQLQATRQISCDIPGW